MIELTRPGHEVVVTRRGSINVRVRRSVGERLDKIDYPAQQRIEKALAKTLRKQLGALDIECEVIEVDLNAIIGDIPF